MQVYTGIGAILLALIKMNAEISACSYVLKSVRLLYAGLYCHKSNSSGFDYNE